jgi:hypothetical protein
LGELDNLVGEQIGSVCFVRDYVELHFNGPILRSLASPVVESGSGRWQFPELGSRDALCALIGLTVEAADDAADALSLDLSDGSRFVVPKWCDVGGPEVAHLVPTTDGKLNVAKMIVWENLRPTREPM